MKNQESSLLNDHRNNTDTSLKFERTKTDNYLDNESRNVENESDEIVSTNRRAADKKLKSSRDKADHKRNLSEHTTPLLDAERKRSDLATNVARDEEDKVRNGERDLKKQIAQDLLNTERTDTDKNLLCERDGTDAASVTSSNIAMTAQQALTTRDTYLGILSHDLKNPLSAISLSTNAMKRAFLKKEMLPENMNKYFDSVERNVATMSRMIEDLLDVEQMVNGDLNLSLKYYDLNEIINECKEFFEPIALSKSFVIEIETTEFGLMANVDHDRILQVLSNLVGNAIKYGKPHGLIKLSAIKNKETIEIFVKNEGVGIPLEKQEIIFERFSQLSGKDRKGAGLGLFISKWIINSHGGILSVKSSPGLGATFSFTIPALAVIH